MESVCPVQKTLIPKDKGNHVFHNMATLTFDLTRAESMALFTRGIKMHFDRSLVDNAKYRV